MQIFFLQKKILYKIKHEHYLATQAQRLSNAVFRNGFRIFAER